MPAEALPCGCRWYPRRGCSGSTPASPAPAQQHLGIPGQAQVSEPGGPPSASFPAPAVTQAPLLQPDSFILRSRAAFLSCVSILCNWPCQRSPYITTATPGTCPETHACLPSLSAVIFCTWMDSTLIQELLKIKKPHWQASETHRAWHNSFSCLSQTVSVYWSIKTWAQHIPEGGKKTCFTQSPSLHSSRASSLNENVLF